MSHFAVFCEDEFDHEKQRSTHRAVAVGRFSYKHKSTMDNYGSKSAMRYLAKMYLSAIIEAEGILGNISANQLKEILIQKEHFEKTCNEQVELVDFEYLSA